jgi:hypothetical protein
LGEKSKCEVEELEDNCSEERKDGDWGCEEDEGDRSLFDMNNRASLWVKLKKVDCMMSCMIKMLNY